VALSRASFRQILVLPSGLAHYHASIGIGLTWLRVALGIELSLGCALP
jgi:hypothetical protein